MKTFENRWPSCRRGRASSSAAATNRGSVTLFLTRTHTQLGHVCREAAMATTHLTLSSSAPVGPSHDHTLDFCTWPPTFLLLRAGTEKASFFFFFLEVSTEPIYLLGLCVCAQLRLINLKPLGCESSPWLPDNAHTHWTFTPHRVRWFLSIDCLPPCRLTSFPCMLATYLNSGTPSA